MKKSRSRHSKGMHHHSLNCLLFLGDSTKGVDLDVAQGQIGIPLFCQKGIPLSGSLLHKEFD